MLKVYSDGNTNYELLLEDKIEELSKYIKEVEDKNDALKAKLEKIKALCNEAPAIDSELSLRILEVIEGEGEE